MSIPFAALLIGLVSSLHCFGMCGGIAGALACSLPPEARATRGRLPYLLAYNLGRIGSYALAGALVGIAGDRLFHLLSPVKGHLLLQGFAALLLAGQGFYLAGWFPRMAMIERLGSPLWRRIEPFGRRLLPVRSPLQALAYGAVWGWLPCGLVYSALMITVTAGGPGQGALFMTLFGAGTLPSMMGAGMLSRGLLRLARAPRFRQAAGLGLVAMALAGLLFGEQLHSLDPFGRYQQPLGCITNEHL